MTGEEWALIAPLMPPPKTTGQPRMTDRRDPLHRNDFPPVSTVRGYFHMQRDNQDENAGLVDRREGVARVESRQSRVAPAMGGSDGRDRLG